MRHLDLRDTDYPAIRRVMGSERERLDDEELENVLERIFPGSEPEEVEDFMQTVQQFGKQVAPIAQKVGPGMAQGAMQGSTLGPWGMLAGAAGGAASTLLSGGAGAASPQAARSGGPSSGATLALPGPLPTAPAASPAGPAAAAQLLALLSQPETLQALLALALAQLGRNTVPLGQHQVPAEAFANAISELAGEAAQVGTGSTNNGSSYWFDPHGAPRCDVASPSARAALLWSDMAEAAEAEEWDQEEEDEEEDEQAELDDFNPMDSFESALAGEHSDDY
jgi:hypothetical protein